MMAENNPPESFSDKFDILSTAEMPQEVTHEDHLQTVQSKTTFNHNHRSSGTGKGTAAAAGMRRGLTHLMGGNNNNGRPGGALSKKTADNLSVKSLQSIANYTVGSYETVKVSNIKESKSATRKDSHKKRWNKLKRMMGVKSASGSAPKLSIDGDDGDLVAGSRRQRAHTEDSTNQLRTQVGGRRVRSSPSTPNNNGGGAVSRRQQQMLDDSIRGRLDGVDTLYLGGAQFAVAAAGGNTTSNNETPAPWTTPMEYTFTGKAPNWSPGQVVSEMMWSSAGKDPPEIMLDGLCPGADGRWSVRMEDIQPQNNNERNAITPPQKQQQLQQTVNRRLSFESPPPALQPTGSCDTSDDGSPNLSSHKLRKMLWGSNPAPADVLEADVEQEDNPMHILAVRCSIPIDVDDDRFLISTREHIQSIHDIAALNLSKGRLSVAFRIFNTLLHGLDGVTDPDELRFEKGATLHNMGVLQLWQQSQHSNAIETFNQALDERIMQLPPNHPDVIVSLVRKANALFAVGKLEETIAALEKALTLIPTDHVVCAKVLNNLGVAYYFQRDYKTALKEFTKALEIQRHWLEGPLRRETSVYDASVTLSNMGKVYLEQSDFDLSFYLYEEALLLLTTIFRKDHDMVLTTLTSLAMAKAQKGELDSALQILQGCLRSQNSRFGVLSPASIETVGLSGFLYARHGEFENSLKCLLTVRKWQKGNLPEKHPALLRSRECIKAIEAKLGGANKSAIAKVWV